MHRNAFRSECTCGRVYASPSPSRAGTCAQDCKLCVLVPGGAAARQRDRTDKRWRNAPLFCPWPVAKVEVKVSGNVIYAKIKHFYVQIIIKNSNSSHRSEAAGWRSTLGSTVLVVIFNDFINRVPFRRCSANVLHLSPLSLPSRSRMVCVF